MESSSKFGGFSDWDEVCNRREVLASVERLVTMMSPIHPCKIEVNESGPFSGFKIRRVAPHNCVRIALP
jgi:hypothetical protein